MPLLSHHQIVYIFSSRPLSSFLDWPCSTHLQSYFVKILQFLQYSKYLCTSLSFLHLLNYSPTLNLLLFQGNTLYYTESHGHHACHSQPPFQRCLHQHHHLLCCGAAHGQSSLSCGGCWGSPPAVAGADEEPPKPLQAKLRPAPQPQPG